VKKSPQRRYGAAGFFVPVQMTSSAIEHHLCIFDLDLLMCEPEEAVPE
jgi:hypothetical protein